MPSLAKDRYRIGEPEFIVLVVGRAAPEPNGVDGGIGRAPFAFGQEFGLLGVDAGWMVFAVDSGDVIERVVLRDGEADKAFVENVGAADRLPVVARARIRLPAVERARLRRVRRAAGSGAFR